MDTRENLTSLYQAITTRVSAIQKHFPVNPENQCSRDNLLAYAVLRGYDIHQLQADLDERGLSTLENSEGHVIHSIEQVLGHLHRIINKSELDTNSMSENETASVLTSMKARQIVEERSKRLFGPPRQGRRSRIMVTMDPRYLEQESTLENLLLNGMDLARINCAHHTCADWQRMIDGLRIAEARLAASNRGIGRKCKIVMDLGGPKIRTGNIEVCIQPIKISVNGKEPLVGVIDFKSEYTETISQTTSQSSFQATSIWHPAFVLAVNASEDLQTMEQGDKFTFQDARGKKRSLLVTEKINEHRFKVEIKKTAMIHNGTIIKNKKNVELQVRSIKPQPESICCTAGDTILLYRDPERLGHMARDESPIGIACTIPKALDDVKVGERVYIDDGKISSVIKKVESEHVTLEVVAPKGRYVTIKEYKGLNFPDSKMKIPALTRLDRRDLQFIVKHADAVNFSFVHNPQDLYDLSQALVELDAQHVGIIAKIETKDAIYNLTKILVAGLGLPSFGVMIARGDLAVDVGFEALPFVQEDILDLCQAAHVPTILATQYLENLAKKGMPARGEIIDAAMAQRADCIMLNKGEHIASAVETLGHVLVSQELRHRNKQQVYKRFTKQNGVFDNN